MNRYLFLLLDTWRNQISRAYKQNKTAGHVSEAFLPLFLCLSLVLPLTARRQFLQIQYIGVCQCGKHASLFSTRFHPQQLSGVAAALALYSQRLFGARPKFRFCVRRARNASTDESEQRAPRLSLIDNISVKHIPLQRERAHTMAARPISLHTHSAAKIAMRISRREQTKLRTRRVSVKYHRSWCVCSKLRNAHVMVAFSAMTKDKRALQIWGFQPRHVFRSLILLRKN